MPLILGLLALLSLTLPAHGISAPKLQLVVEDHDVQYQDYCLPSGLRVVFQVDHSQPVVSVTTVVGSGAAADPEGMQGMAHLVEHLWFRSSHPQVPAVWQLRNRMGAWMNGYTNFDTTKYTTVAPSQNIRTLLEVEGHRLEHALNGVDTEIFETEREVVRNELRQNYENTGASGLSSAYLRLFPPGHPYHRSIIGNHESLDAIDLEAAVAFAAQHYTPANITIMVVGDVDPEATSAWLSESLPTAALEGPGSQCEPRLPAASPPVPDPVDTSFVWEKAEVDHIQALITWAVPGGYRPIEGLERMVMGMLDWSLERYQSRDPDCSLFVRTEASVIACTLDLSPPDDPRDIQDPEQRLRRALDGVHELWDMNNRGWQDYSYGRSRLVQAANLFLAGEEVSGTYSTRSTRMTEHLHQTGGVDYFTGRLAWLEPIRVGHAAEFAAEYLDKRRAVVTILVPTDQRSEVISGDIHHAAQLLDSDMPRDGTVAEEVARLLVPLDLEPLVDFELDNGLRVLLLPFGTMPYARVGLLLPGGVIHEPSAQVEKLTWHNTRTLWQDEQGMSMSLAPSAVGGEWTLEFGPGWHEYAISGSGGSLEAQLYLLRRRVDSKKLRLDNKGDDIDEWENELWRHRERPEYWAETQAWSRLAPDHPAMRPLDEAGLEALRGLGMADIKAWSRSIVSPEQATIVVVGRYDQDRAKDWVERWWGDWSPRGERVPLPSPAPLPAPPERSILVLDKPTATQTQVALRCQLPGLDLEHALAQDLAAGMLTSRTKYELRVTSGWTYGVHRRFESLPGVGRLLTMDTSVQNSAAGQTVATILALMDEVGGQGVEAKALEGKQINRAQSYAQGQQTTKQVLNRIMWPLERGLGLAYLSGYGEQLGAVTPGDLVAQLDSCREHEVITLVGPAGAIGEQLGDLGIDFELYDWQSERDHLMQDVAPKRWAKAQKAR